MTTPQRAILRKGRIHTHTVCKYTSIDKVNPFHMTTITDALYTYIYANISEGKIVTK